MISLTEEDLSKLLKQAYELGKKELSDASIDRQLKKYLEELSKDTPPYIGDPNPWTPWAVPYYGDKFSTAKPPVWWDEISTACPRASKKVVIN